MTFRLASFTTVAKYSRAALCWPSPPTCHAGTRTIEDRRWGSLLVNFAKTVLTGAFPEIWLFVLGGLFVIVTLFMPRGLIGLWSSVARRWRRPEGTAVPALKPMEAGE